MKTIIALLMLLAASGAALAGNDWSVDWHTIDGGGTMEAAGGNWELKGTTGQHDASEANELAGGSWELTGGFWGVLSEFGELLNQIFSDRFEDG